MPEVFPVTAAPLAPPCPSGRPGAYGIWHSDATLPNGATAWGRGLSEATARESAQRRARLAWEELRAHLPACEMEAAALEAGDV